MSDDQISQDFRLAKQLAGARPPDFQGTLKKKGVTPGWSERYFRLFGNKLIYYKNDQFVGNINLTNSGGRLLEEGKFALSGPYMKREFKLDATTPANRTKWLSKLSNSGVEIPGFAKKASPEKKAREQWSCSMCTLVNAGTNNRCEVCGSHYTSRVQTNVVDGQDALMKQIQDQKPSEDQQPQQSVPQQVQQPPPAAPAPVAVEPIPVVAAPAPVAVEPIPVVAAPVQQPAAVYVPQSEVQQQTSTVPQLTQEPLLTVATDMGDIPMAC